jgi:trehalose 2-sulfotransferase
VAKEPGGALLIATTPRSGSWLLSDLLTQSGRIGAGREYFHVNYVAALSRKYGLSTSGITAAYIDEVLRRTAGEGVVFSSKLHWLQINQLVDALRIIHPELARANAPATQLIEASLPGARYLYLFRREKARQAISMFRAVRTDQWWELADAATPDGESGRAAPHLAPPPDHLVIRWLERDLSNEDAEWRSYFEFFGISHYAVAYEDLVADPQPVIRAVLDWLDLADAPVPVRPSRLRRQADSRTERILAEYQQIRGSLTPMPPDWEWLPTRRTFGLPDPADDAGGGLPGAPPPIGELTPL